MLYEDGEIKVNQKLEVTPDILNVMIFWVWFIKILVYYQLGKCLIDERFEYLNYE